VNTVDKILEANPSLAGANLAFSKIDAKIRSIINKIRADIDFSTNLLGGNLNKVVGFKIPNVIKWENGVYTLETKDFKIRVKSIVSEDEDLAKHSDVSEILKGYATLDNIFDTVQIKQNILTNVVSIKDLMSNEKAISKSSRIFAKDCYIKLEGPINENSYINKKYFLDNFYSKTFVQEGISVTLTDSDGNEVLPYSVFLENCKLKEIVLDYTLEEIEGAGCKLSDFTETQAAASPVDGEYQIYVKVSAVGDMTVTVNGTDFTYSIENPDNDTPDIVADTLGQDIADSINGVSYETLPGYYSATPADDDGGHIIGWYVEDTSDGASYSVSLTEDNSSEHDLTVKWDSDNNNLIVTYASDGSDTLYPTVSELIDAVNNAGAPIKAIQTDMSYDADNDYPYVMDFDLNQYDSVIKLTSSNQSLTISSSQEYFNIETIQDYVEGKHQKGSIVAEVFRRGYTYYIKVDDKEYSIDTTDDNNPDVDSGVALINKFYDLITNDDESVVDATTDNNTILLIGKDYSEHTIETSGAQDYVEPLPRDVSVRNDLKDYAIQDEESKIFKEAKTDISQAKDNTPLCREDINSYVEQGLFPTANKGANIVLDKTSFALNPNLIKMSDIDYFIKEKLALNPDLFPKTKFKYISKYDSYIDCALYTPKYEKAEKFFILEASGNYFADKRQLQFLGYIDLKYLQETLLGLGDDSFSQDLNAVCDYLEVKSVKSLNKLKAIKNTPVTNDTINFIKHSTADTIVKTPPEFFGQDDESVKKYKIMADILIRHSDTMLDELIDVLSEYTYTPDDIRWVLEFDEMRNTVLDINTEDAPPEETGLDGESSDGEITFEKLYIREYKAIFKQEYSSTNIDDYLLIDADSLPDTVKHLLVYPGVRIETKELFYEEKVGTYTNPSDDQKAQWDADKTYRYTCTGDGDNETCDVWQTKSYFPTNSFTTKPFNVRLFHYNPYDLLIYRELVRTGYFPQNLDYFKDKIGTGRLPNGDSVWRLLISAISFSGSTDDIQIKYAGDAYSVIKLLFNKFENLNDWRLALVLGNDPYISKEIGYTTTSALLVLFSKIYAYLIKENVATTDYESVFNSCVSLLFKGDASAGITLPYCLFERFVAIIKNGSFKFGEKLTYSAYKDYFVFEPNLSLMNELSGQNWGADTLNLVISNNTVEISIIDTQNEKVLYLGCESEF